MDVNNISNEKHREFVFDAPALMVVRFRNFLHDGARNHAPCCVKGLASFLPAIFKTFSENVGIGNRTRVLPLGLEPGRGTRTPMTTVVVIGVPVLLPRAGGLEPL